MEKMTTKTFKSTFEREQYIKANPAAGGGTVEDAAKRLSYDLQRVKQLIAEGKLGALIVPLKDGTQDIIVPESEIQRYGVTRTDRPGLWPGVPATALAPRPVVE